MSSVTEAGPFERILTMKIAAEELAAAKKTAARRLAREVKIKGFRPGKAPLKVVESAVGAATLRREAIDDALPKALATAIGETDLQPAVMPRLQDIRDDEGGVEVDVLVTLWPTIDALPRYRERTVEIEAATIDEAAVDEQIDRMRNQLADLEDVDREAFDGDFVVVDVTTTRDGEEFAAGSTTDLLLEVGAGMFLKGMDDALRGSAAGAIQQFTTTLPPAYGEEDAEVDVRVLVKQVKAKRLPDLTDEWVDDVTEFETVAEMRAGLEEQMRRARDHSLRSEYERALLGAMTEALDLVLPDGLVEAEMDGVFHRFAHRLEQQGIEFGQYLELTGQDQSAFLADLRSQAEMNLETRLMLEAVAEAEGITVTEAELHEAIVGLAAAAGMEVAAYEAALAEGGQEETLTGDILRRKAVDRLLELAVPVDSEGNEVDMPAPQGAAGQADGGERPGAESESESESAEAQDRQMDDGREPAEEE